MKELKIQGFEFEEVSLQEAQLLVSAGQGNYAELIIGLAQAIPQFEKANYGLALDKCKTPKFSLPKGSKPLDDKTIKNVCHAVNLGLNKQGVNWVVRYIPKEKCFVCVPKGGKSTPRGRFRSSDIPAHVVSKIGELAKEGMKVKEISKKTGINLGSTYSVIDRLKKGWLPRQPSAAEPTGELPPASTNKTGLSAQDLVAYARKVLGYAGEFKSGPDLASRPFRAAVSAVGLGDLKLTGRRLDEALGLKRGGSSWYSKSAKSANEADVASLRLALRQKGVL